MVTTQAQTMCTATPQRTAESRPREFSPLEDRLLLQIRLKVCNHGDGLVDLLRHPDQKNLLAVGGNVIENLGCGPIADQRLRSTELQGTVGLLYRNGENIVGPV